MRHNNLTLRVIFMQSIFWSLLFRGAVFLTKTNGVYSKTPSKGKHSVLTIKTSEIITQNNAIFKRFLCMSSQKRKTMNSKLFVLFHFVFSCLEWLERVTWCAVAMSLDTWDSREVYESDQWNQTYVEEIKLAAPVNWYLNVFEH